MRRGTKYEVRVTRDEAHNVMDHVEKIYAWLRPLWKNYLSQTCLLLLTTYFLPLTSPICFIVRYEVPNGSDCYRPDRLDA